MLDYLRQIDFGILKSLNETTLRNSFLESLAMAFGRYGIIIFALIGLYFILRKKWRTVGTAAITIAIAGFLNSLIDIFWDRPRPFVAHAADIRQIGFLLQPESFTSNHAFITFGVATALWVTGQKKIAIFLYICASLIIVARVAGGAHYPSDVIAGALLGIVVAPLAKQIYLLVQLKTQKLKIKTST